MAERNMKKLEVVERRNRALEGGGGDRKEKEVVGKIRRL